MRGIELRNARVRHGPVAAPAATVTVLLGANGSGRTTALRALAGTLPLTTGAVLRDGEDITRRPPHERAARGLTFVPDRRAVFPTLTVAENLELSGTRADTARALDAYPELRPLLSRPAGTLSGGEQRMLALSRALRKPHSHHETPVILIDEPTQGMSPQVAARTYALLTALTTLPACVVLAEQRLPPALRANAGRAAGTAGTAVLVHELRRGTVVFSGEAAELSPSG
ncbi:ATP-binding cassette domain-containing protein [Streptomyces sp. NRRL S-1521]|uniref:ATP-binding cassette domain-containing protein n=1 Tax=Streptomyces sp. NRRL S-1521 TaxID=1609100 RepID=UPI000747387E|nr:ATP-binding cassette domain-containing protein [Streptomyces sp. NRRL S-1521]KUL48888.1 ABC transporter [Streptomyces sp. NRRL S-1521]